MQKFPMNDLTDSPTRSTRIPRWGTAAYVAISVFGLIVWHKVDYAFTNYVFGDIGSSWHAIRLIRNGSLPGVDYAYQYGAFSLGIFDLGLRSLGNDPVGCWRFGLVCTILLGTICLVYARRIEATASAWILGSCWIIASQRILFLSAAHAVEPVVLASAVLAASSGRPETAVALSVVAWFVKPSMAIILGSLFFCWRLLDASGIRDALSMAGRMLAQVAITAVVCFGVSALWLGHRSALSMVVPNQGVSVYKAMNFGFFRGTGSYLWNMPGGSLGYYFGTEAAAWLTINLAMILLALATIIRWFGRKLADHAYRDRPGELFVILVTAHSAFVCLFFGTFWTWSYYAWLLWMAMMLGMTWASRHCVRQSLCISTSIALALLTVVGNYSNFESTRSSVLNDVPVEDRYGLYGSPNFATAWRQVRTRMDDRPTYVSLMFGEGEGVLGPPFFSAPFWCIAPGDTFRPMFDAWERSVSKADQIIQYVPDNLHSYPQMRQRIESEFSLETFEIDPSRKLYLWRRKDRRPE